MMIIKRCNTFVIEPKTISKVLDGVKCHFLFSSRKYKEEFNSNPVFEVMNESFPVLFKCHCVKKQARTAQHTDPKHLRIPQQMPVFWCALHGSVFAFYLEMMLSTFQKCFPLLFLLQFLIANCALTYR